MVQKRVLEVEEAHEISSKLPRKEVCNNRSLFPDINSFEDASHVSGLSAHGGFSEGKLVFEKELPSKERDIVDSPGKDDDQDSSLLPGSCSFSSGGTSGTSDEDVCIQAPFNTCFFPEYFYPERPATTLTRRGVIYSLLLECPPQKKVPIGTLHQADIPQLEVADGNLNQVDSISSVEDGDKVEEPLAGTCIIPMPTTTLSVDDVVKPEHGITDCSCLYKGSIRCVRQHVTEARDKLKALLGVQVFEELGFSSMGEQVAEKWTEDEESLFHEVVFSNPSSMGKNFWNCLSHSFPSRTKAEIVSYYFNVFMLRKRAEQNRLDPMNADSDNDEWQAVEDEDDDSVVESPFHQLRPLDEGEGNYEETHKENISDEACDADDRPSPVQETWNESERLYHGTQDDSCTSFDTRAAMPPGMQMTMTAHDGGFVRLRSKGGPIRTEDVFRDELPIGQGTWEKGPG